MDLKGSSGLASQTSAQHSHAKALCTGSAVREAGKGGRYPREALSREGMNSGVPRQQCRQQTTVGVRAGARLPPETGGLRQREDHLLEAGQGCARVPPGAVRGSVNDQMSI